jgi:hypothetical protein
MTRFIKAGQKVLFNIDQINRIESRPNKEVCVFFNNGENATFHNTVDDIEQRLLPVVPAAPNFTVLRYFYEEVEDPTFSVERSPIVAWHIDKDIALPITVDCFNIMEDDNSAILLPDGQVIQQYVERFPNEEAWKASRREEGKRKTEQEKALNQKAGKLLRE